MTMDSAGLAWEVMAGFDDPATATFDAILAASGLDEMTARALRFWQRESVHNTRQYAASAVPAVLEAVARAQADAEAATERGADAWQGAGHPAPVRPAAAASAPAPVRSTAAPLAAEPIPTPSPAPMPADVTSDELLEMRRRTVAARLAHLG